VRKLFVALVAMGWMVCLTGCGAKSGAIPTIPVEGKVTIDGKAPAGPFRIELQSDDAKIPVINGYVKADGSFKLTTNQPEDGAPEGNFKVTVGPDPLYPATTPNVKPTTLTIAKPTSGKVATVELNLESAGPAGGMIMSPLPPPPGQGQQ
jgi:hypothetical protein